MCFGFVGQHRALNILFLCHRCHLAHLNLLSHASSMLIHSSPPFVHSGFFFAVQSSIFSLLLYVFSAIFHFVFSPFHLRHASLVSWCWYTFHLVVFSPPLVSLLWCIALCFPFISSTVCFCGVLFRFGGPCRKQRHVWRLPVMCTVCISIIQHIVT